MAQDRPYPADLPDGAEAAAQQSAAQKALPPLAVELVGLGASFHVFEIAGVYDSDFQAGVLENLIQVDPVYARRFHGDGLHAQLEEPVANGSQIVGVGLEALDVALAELLRDAHPMLARADIHEGRQGLQSFETARRNLTRAYGAGFIAC